ncbi:MAG: hypothetical protein A2309_13370 [Bacteroidetes bacterium RIFOXYB2_FULL_35_7]|nr:MAG: hypothetical protein A2309_13370 [Bacteroidetes bacterium RIFOXYB2_FULL_35_7]
MPRVIRKALFLLTGLIYLHLQQMFIHPQQIMAGLQEQSHFLSRFMAQNTQAVMLMQMVLYGLGEQVLLP